VHEVLFNVLPKEFEPDLALWTIDDVATWLTTIGCEDCVESFRAQAITGIIIPLLTDDVLKDQLGIVRFGQRQLILIAVEYLKQRNTTTTTTTTTTMTARSRNSTHPHGVMSPRHLAAGVLDAAAAIAQAVGNTSFEHFQFMRTHLLVNFVLAYGGSALVLALPANPWWFLVLTLPLFGFTLLAIQRVTLS
jgi:hypothetical protein